MRKFTLLFAFLLSLIGVTQAQTVITDLGSLSNGKVYILSAGDKGTLQVNDDATAIVRAAELTKAENQQFAILKSIAGTYHLYSVSAQKIVSRLELKPFTGSSDFLASAVTLVPHAPNGEASGKFVIKSGNDLYNINGENNLVVNGWNTHDAGNGFQIEEVGDLGELSADMQKHLKISTSTAEQPVYYAIKNTRANKYASAELSSENRMRLVTLQPESFFYFTDASAAAKGEIPEGGKAVYIHNVATNKVLAGHTQNPWGDDGMVYYIVPAAKVNTSNTTGYVITKSLTDLGGGSSWNNFQGQGAQVDSWNADDEGSIWSFEYKTAADLVATIEAVLPEAKATAIAEADIEKNRAYYSVSEEAYNECVSAIYSLTATNCSEYLAAKENMQTALAKLKVSERVNPLQGGEIVIIHNRKNAQRYITTDAAEEKAEAEVSLVKGKATVDTRSLWTVVAVENGKFKLCNALSGKYIQHQGDNNLTLVNAEDATAYAFINKENHWILIDAGDVDNRHVNIRDWQGAEDVAGWTDENDQGNHWEIIAPTAEQLARLVELQTPIETLKAEAVKQLENKIEAFKNENNALDFYNVSAEAITVCENAIKAEIQNVTTHAALEVIKNGMDAAIAQLWNSADNRVNPVTAGVKVKFRNKAINKYMVAEAAGVNTADNATSASVWTLVDDDDANTVGYYLYNPLNHTYVKHAADNGQQATLVADKAQATLYEVIPTGAYVFIRETVENNYNEDYLHADTRTNFVTRWLASDDRSLWTVTSATEVENSQLASDIQTNITPQLNAALDAANEVVAPYKPLEFYRPTQAIDAYEAVIATITGVDTYDELAQALAAVASAKAAFEAAIAADDVKLENPVSDGEQIKLRNRLHSEYWMSAIDGKVGMKSAADASSIWTLKAAADGGFYLLNPLTNKYVKHIDQRDTKFELVEGTEEASVYYVHPNGLYVTVGRLAEQSKDEGNREYLHGVNWNADGQWVVRWNAVAEASQWGIFKTTEAEKTQLPADIVAYVKATITAAQEEALQNANAADDFAYYACSAENVAIAVAAINKVSTEITTHEQLSQGLAAINAALKTLYDSERTAGPAAGDRIRFINRIYTTHYLGYNSTGLAHYEPNTADDATENLPSTTIWQLEKSEKEGEFYLKNYLLGLYACFEKYNSDSQIVLRQEKNHPVKLIQKETIDGMLYFDIETQNTEVNGLYKSVHATDNGFTVQGNPDNYGSHWMITRATDEDLNSVNLTAQLSALIDFILKPVIEEAKRYYYVDAEGQVVNNFVDDVKAGYYTYTGDGTWDTYKESYVIDINRCISISENVDRTNSDQVYAAADLLRANIAKFSLNLPRTNGFFRLKCVYNDQYLQADDKRKTLALNEETGKASIFYFEAKGNGDDANTSLGTLVSYDQGLYFTQGSNSSGIYAKLQPIGTAGDTFSFTIPANNTFGSYNISSASGDHKRYLYGNAVERTELQVIDGDSVEVKYYRADNGDNATAAIQGDANNNGYNWVMERVDAIPVTISAAGWATFYAPIAMGIPEGVKAYICTGMDSNYELTLVRLSEVIPAGTAVLLEGTAGTYLFIDKEFEVTAENQSTENNCLRGVLAKTWRDPSRQNLNQDMTFEEGSNINIDYPVESGKVYTLGVEDGKVAMYRYAGNQFRHFCSYLDLPTESTAGFDVLRFGKIEEPTAIEEAPVVSLENVIIYDLSGRRVAEPGKGVYIVNGKKVYFK